MNKEEVRRRIEELLSVLDELSTLWKSSQDKEARKIIEDTYHKIKARVDELDNWKPS